MSCVNVYDPSFDEIFDINSLAYAIAPSWLIVDSVNLDANVQSLLSFNSDTTWQTKCTSLDALGNVVSGAVEQQRTTDIYFDTPCEYFAREFEGGKFTELEHDGTSATDLGEIP
jgi:hypothetical protein